jgi:hypothetical protein
MTEGSGSGSGRLIDIWLLRIRIRIRIHYTDMQNEWKILNIYDFSLSAPILLFAVNGWGWTPVRILKNQFCAG